MHPLCCIQSNRLNQTLSIFSSAIKNAHIEGVMEKPAYFARELPGVNPYNSKYGNDFTTHYRLRMDRDSIYGFIGIGGRKNIKTE